LSEYRMWDLKETAKWSDNPEERKAAIKTLSARGETAVPSLEEIMAVTAYEEIRMACIEAMKAAREKNLATEGGGKTESRTERATAGAELADLPP
jgi:hypothetical protein